MTLNISFSADAEAKLRQRAAQAGKDLPTFVRDAVEEKLASMSPVNLTAEAWSAALHAWASSHAPVNHVVDDSRESIYAGRGE